MEAPNYYRKKPVVIEAAQVVHQGTEEHKVFMDWLNTKVAQSPHCDVDIEENRVIIYTLEGAMEAQPGDYIIFGTAKELYPCKPQIFRDTYEKV